MLSDVIMPRVGGPELAERLRERGAKVPVLLMTGYDERPQGSNGAGDTAILAKPFGQEELLKAIETACGHPDRA